MMGKKSRNFKCKLGLASPIIFLGICIFFAKLGDAKPAEESPSIVSSKKSDSFPEEDSDMLMEPNDFSSISVIRSQGQQFFPTSTEFYAPSLPAQDSHSQAAQNFYPPFFREIPPLGHSRPYFQLSDVPSHIAKFSASHSPPIGTRTAASSRPTANQRSYDASILGSGDFGVIRGGTFYPEEEMPYHPDENSESINQFFGDNANNGHGRPQGDGFVEKYTFPEEQFANFRDFADINTPGDPAFSQFVVVYAAKNSTRSSNQTIPKNIFEQLEMLDKEKAMEEKKTRISKSKVKLLNTKLEKKYKKKANPKDVEYEPLLALS